MLYGSFTVPDPIRTSVVGVGLFARFKRLPELNPAMKQPECYRLNPSPQQRCYERAKVDGGAWRDV